MRCVRFAVISDIQGNLAALEAVLKDLDARNDNLDRIVSAGDVVGRGPNPNEVIDLMRDRGIDSVRGNYDDAVVLDRPESGTDFLTAEELLADVRALAWTRQTLTETNRTFLTELPSNMRMLRAGRGMRITRNSGDERTNDMRKQFFLRALFGGLVRSPPPSRNKKVLLVHGSPRARNEFIREDTANSILSVVAKDAESDIMITAHASTAYQRDALGVTFIGIGGVSPVHGSPGRAEYAVIDIGDTVETEFETVEYDPRLNQAAVQAVGLPLNSPGR